MFQGNHTLIHAFGNNNQIIDVTEQCTFEWYQEPSSCKAYLEVSSASGDFTEGETIQGQSSGATATVFSSYVDGSRVYVENVSGTFQTGETIQGQSSGQTATVDSFVEERSYPDNITHGTFPDSIISEDLDDYLEWESSLEGAGYSSKLRIKFPETGLYICVPTYGSGQIVGGSYVRQVYMSVNPPRFAMVTHGNVFLVLYDKVQQDTLMAQVLSSGLVNIQQQDDELSVVLLSTRHNGKSSVQWRIHNIKVLKLIV